MVRHHVSQDCSDDARLAQRLMQNRGVDRLVSQVMDSFINKENIYFIFSGGFKACLGNSACVEIPASIVHAPTFMSKHSG